MKIKKRKRLVDKFINQSGRIDSIFIVGLIMATISVSLYGSKSNLRIMGYPGFDIETFNMHSVYPAESLFITKHNGRNEYIVEDDISFFDRSKDGAIVTHRLVELESDDQGYFYITKGVNNSNIDENPRYYKNYMGNVKYSVPDIGVYIDNAKQNFILVIGLVIGSFILFKQVKSIVNNKKNGVGNNETDPKESL